jgi:hypothetical protein
MPAPLLVTSLYGTMVYSIGYVFVYSAFVFVYVVFTSSVLLSVSVPYNLLPLDVIMFLWLPTVLYSLDLSTFGMFSTIYDTYAWNGDV